MSMGRNITISLILCTLLNQVTAFFACRDSDYRQIGGDKDYNILDVKASLIEDDYTLAMGVTAEKNNQYLAAVWILQSDICSTRFRFNVPNSSLWALQIRNENSNHLVVHTLLQDTGDDKSLNYARYYPDFKVNRIYGEPEVKSLEPTTRFTFVQTLAEVPNSLQLMTGSDVTFAIDQQYMMRLDWSSAGLISASFKQSTNEVNLQLLVSETSSYIIRRENGATDIHIVAILNDLTSERQVSISRDFTDPNEQLTVRLDERVGVDGVFMCSQSSTSHLNFDLLNVSPTSNSDAIYSIQEQSGIFECLAVRGTQQFEAEFLLWQQEKRVGLLSFNFQTGDASIKMSAAPNNELLSMNGYKFAILHQDDQFIFGTTPQFNGLTAQGTKAFAMNTGRHRRTVFYESSSSPFTTTSVTSILTSLNSPMADIPEDSANFDLDVSQYANDFVKDNWVLEYCPMDWKTNGLNNIAWNSCSLINEDEYAYCLEQAGYHRGTLDNFLFTGENPDDERASQKSVCFPLDVTSQITYDNAFEVTKEIAQYQDVMPASKAGWLSIYVKGYMMDSWQVADASFFFGRGQIFYTRNIQKGDNFVFEILTHLDRGTRDNLKLRLISKKVETIETFDFINCLFTFANVEGDFISFDEDAFTLRVNGFDTQNLADGTYVFVRLIFVSDETNRLQKLNVFAILNFKSRISGMTESLEHSGEPLININKPWVEYYLTNHQNSTYEMTPPTDEEISDFINQQLEIRAAEQNEVEEHTHAIHEETEVIMLSEDQLLLAQMEAEERYAQAESLASHPVAQDASIDKEGLINIIFSRPVFFPSYMLESGIYSNLMELNNNNNNQRRLRKIPSNQQSKLSERSSPDLFQHRRQLSPMSSYPDDMREAIVDKLFVKKEEVWGEYGTSMIASEENQIGMNFLTLLQTNEDILAAVNLNEDKCEEGYIFNEDFQNCELIHFEGDEEEDQELTIFYFGTLEENIYIKIGDDEQNQNKILTDWKITEVTKLHLQIQMGQDELDSLQVKNHQFEIIIQLEFQDFDPGFMERTLIRTTIPAKDVIESDQTEVGLEVTTGAVLLITSIAILLSQGALSSIWGMIHSIQICVHMIFFNLNMPGVCHGLIHHLQGIVAFQIPYITARDIFGQWLAVREEESYVNLDSNDNYRLNEALADFEYNTRFLTDSIGIGFLVITGIILVLLYLAFCRVFRLEKRQVCCQKSFTYLQNRYIWTIPIRIMLELTIELAFCLQISLIHFNMMDVQNLLEGFDMLLVIGLSMLLFGAPLMILIFLCRSEEWLARMQDKSDLKFQTRWGELYAELKPQRSSLFLNFFFILHRILFAIVAIHTTNPLFQLFFEEMLSFISFAYLVHWRPFTSRQVNALNQFNDVTVILLVCVMVSIASAVGGESAFNATGYIYNIIVLVNIGVYLSLFLVKSIKSLMRRVKKYKAGNVSNMLNREREHKQDVMENVYPELRSPELQFKSTVNNQRQQVKSIIEEAIIELNEENVEEEKSERLTQHHKDTHNNTPISNLLEVSNYNPDNCLIQDQQHRDQASDSTGIFMEIMNVSPAKLTSNFSTEASSICKPNQSRSMNTLYQKQSPYISNSQEQLAQIKKLDKLSRQPLHTQSSKNNKKTALFSTSFL